APRTCLSRASLAASCCLRSQCRHRSNWALAKETSLRVCGLPGGAVRLLHRNQLPPGPLRTKARLPIGPPCFGSATTVRLRRNAIVRARLGCLLLLPQQRPTPPRLAPYI